MRFFKGFIVIFAGILVTSFAIEGVLRLAQAHYEGSVFQADPERGYALRPHAAGWNTVDQDAWIQINSDGMRDWERAPQHPPHVLRIAVLGASEVGAVTVPLKSSFENRMERRLQNALSTHKYRVEVLNFGVPGYTPAQFYLTLKHHIWKYSPQIVMLAVSGFEIIRNTPELYSTPTSGIPFYNLQNGRLIPGPRTPAISQVNSRRQRLKNWLSDRMNRSVFLSLLNEAVRTELPKQIALIKARWIRTPSRAASSSPPADYLATWPYLPNLPQTQKSWAIAEAFFNEINEECRQHGAEFWLIILDEEMQTHPDLVKRAEFARRLGITSLDESDRRLERYCAKHGIRVFNLARPLSAFTATHHWAIRGRPGPRWGSGHWNEIGHIATARLLSDLLLAESQTLTRTNGTPSETPVLARN